MTGRAQRPAGRRRGVARRAASRRSPKTTILIVGEGQKTEPNYFRELRREDNVADKFAVKVKKGHGVSPERVVEEAIGHKQQAERREEDYDQVWCVLDVEGPAHRVALGRAVALAAQPGITLCLSNPCFEVWLLAHFERKARAYNDCDHVIAQLNKWWQKHCRQDYRKNDDRVYHRVSDLTQTAVDNAKCVRETYHRGVDNTADCNSSTEVYRLVTLLTG